MTRPAKDGSVTDIDRERLSAETLRELVAGTKKASFGAVTHLILKLLAAHRQAAELRVLEMLREEAKTFTPRAQVRVERALGRIEAKLGEERAITSTYPKA